MKATTRKAVETYILDFVQEVDVSGTNRDLYKKLFLNMSDKDLVKLVEKYIPIYAPNNSAVHIDPYLNVGIGKKMGHNFYERCWITDPKTGATHLTKYEHMIVEVPCRRQSQMIDKKTSIASHNRTIDKTTGQPTGASKGSSFSFPEIYVMFSKGYDDTLKELIQIRGGDLKAYRVIDRNIRNTGSSSQKFEGSERTRVKSSQTFGAILTAQHLGNSLL